MGEYVLYMHRNKTNGKRYIGITNNVARRWSGQGNRYDHSPRFYNAIQKYGWDGFTHEIILDGLTLEEANRYEIEYIARYQTQDKSKGYNIAPGGDYIPSTLGRHHSEETKKKISEKARGRVKTAEECRHHSEVMKGRHRGSEHPRSKAVRCITTGEVFESQHLAAEAKKVRQGAISQCCLGHVKHTHGLQWEYVVERT